MLEGTDCETKRGGVCLRRHRDKELGQFLGIGRAAARAECLHQPAELSAWRVLAP